MIGLAENSFLYNITNKIFNGQKFNFKNGRVKYLSKTKNTNSNNNNQLSIKKSSINTSCSDINYIQKNVSHINSTSSININLNISNRVYEINKITNFVKENNNDNEKESYKHIDHENYYDIGNEFKDKNIYIVHGVPYDFKNKSNCMDLVGFLTKPKKNKNTITTKLVKPKIIPLIDILKQDEEKCSINKNIVDNNLLKLELNEKIDKANLQIKTLQSIVQSKYLKILYMKLDFEKKNVKDKFRKNLHNLSDIIFQYKNQKRSLEIIKDKYDKSFIKKEVSENELNNEDLKYKIQKLNLIKKILEYQLIIKNKTDENIEENSSLNSSRLLVDEKITSKNTNINKIQVFKPIISINNIKNKCYFNESNKNKKSENN